MSAPGKARYASVKAKRASGRTKHAKGFAVTVAALFFLQITAAVTGAYSLGTTVADMTQPAALSGGTSCPQLTRFDVSTPGAINRQWSIALPTNPPTILTANQKASVQLNEIESVIETSLAVWTGVAGTTLSPASLAPLQRNIEPQACLPDGINSICFDQNDPGFTFGVLAFTRVVTADTIGQQISSTSSPSTFVGEILDADVLVDPNGQGTTFATPAALAANPSAYDLESILTHELGHSFGFNHSAVWNAVMFPFAPAPGQFAGPRPSASTPDAPLSDDDRAGLRILYPNPTDTVHVGSISGHVLPANPLALPLSPVGVTGIFPAQVVALDAATGTVSAAIVGGWSCADPGPAQFDGTFLLQALPVSATQSYEIYAEPLDGPVTLGDVIEDDTSLCRNPATDPEWPEQFACTVPAPAAPFSARMRNGP